MRRYFTLSLLLLLLASPSLAAPKVVVSIAPLQALVSELMLGVGTPELLLPRNSSPHSASLRPSQAQALSEAELMIWIGPELESFLTQPIQRLVSTPARMQLLELKSLKLLNQREGGLWEEDEHDGAIESAAHRVNPHVWLAPENARQIVLAVATRLIQIDPQNRAAYELNRKSLFTRIDQLQQKLNAQLAPVRTRPYLVFHDAYHYLEEAFALNAIGSIRISAERAPGARRMQQIHEKIAESTAICLFAEPQFSPTLATTLAADSGIKLGTLDPLGSSSGSQDFSWFSLMENLADNLVECLAKGER